LCCDPVVYEIFYHFFSCHLFHLSPFIPSVPLNHHHHLYYYTQTKYGYRRQN
jgi:hypothetical protein